MANAYELFGELKANTSQFEKSLKDSETRLKATEQAIDSTEKAATRIGQTSNTTARSFEKLREAVAQTSQRLQVTAEAFRKGEASASAMRSALLASERASDKLNSSLKDTSARLKDTSSKMTDFAVSTAKAGAVILGGGLIVALKKTLDIGLEYESAMNSLQSNTKATAEEMQRASAKAKELGAATDLSKTSAKNAAVAMDVFVKAGFSLNQALDASRGILQLATAATISEAQAAEIAGNALNAFNLAANQSGKVADLLAGASRSASGEITDMAAALKQSALVFNDAKIPIEDLVTSIAQLAKVGLMGSDAGTSLKTFMQRLQAPTDNAKEAMDKLGISVYDTATHKMRPMVDIIAQFEQGLKGLTEEQRAQTLVTIFGSDAIRGAAALFGKGAESYAKLRTEVTASNQAMEMATAKTRGLGGAWEALKSQLETIAITGFEKFAPSTEQATRVASEWAAKFGSALESELSKQDATVKGVGMKLGEVLGQGLGEGLKTALPNLAKMIETEIRDSLQGKTIPIPIAATVSVGKGLLSGLTGDAINNVQDALLALNKVIQSWANMAVGNSLKVGHAFGQMYTIMYKSLYNAAAYVLVKGREIGSNIVSGIIQGISGRATDAISTIGVVIDSVISAAQGRLAIHSPSRVFFKIGTDTVQGFIDGISSLRASAQSAMASILDVSGLKLSKADKSGVELLTSLIGEISRFNVVGKEQEILLELTAGKYAKLNSAVRERIILAAQEIDRTNASKEAFDKFNETLRSLSITEEPSIFDKLNTLFSDNRIAKNIAELAKSLNLTADGLRLVASQKAFEGITIPQITGRGTDEGVGLGMGRPRVAEILPDAPLMLPPVVKQSWEDFWDTFRTRTAEMRTQAGSVREAIGENFLGLADVLGNVVADFDFTFSGLLKSIGRNFAEMGQQIVSELVRIAVYQGILKILGSFAGGASAPGSIGSISGAPAIAAPGFASGGYTGFGDPQKIAGFVHRKEFVMPSEAVSKWGVGFLSQLANLKMPTMSFASGGYTGGFMPSSSVMNSNNQTKIEIHMHQNSNGQTRTQVFPQASERQAKEQLRNWVNS